MSDLKDYYRHAVAARVTEIESAVEHLESGRDDASGTIRRVAHSLRGSGGTYGFPEVSAAAALVEDADDASLLPATGSLLTVLHRIVGAASPKARILIVDDDAEIVLLLRTVLGAPNREIRVAPTAAAAADILAAERFDVILLDLLLPDADGRTVLRALRELPDAKHSFVMVLSGKSANATADDCIALGADAYVAKPFDPEAVAERVTRQLERRA